MNKKQLEQLRHFIHLMDECYTDVENAKASKNAEQLEEAETDLVETETAMLQYMHGILYDAGMIPATDDGSNDEGLPY